MRRRKGSRIGFWFLTLCLLCTMGACSKRAENIRGSVKIATGPSHLVYHQLGKKIQFLLDQLLPMVKINLQQTEGTKENLRLLMNRKVDLAILQGDIAARLWNESKRGSELPFRRLQVLHREFFYVIVAKTAPIQGIQELKGTKIAVIGGEKSGSFLNVTDILQAYGVKKSDVSLIPYSLAKALTHLTQPKPSIQAIFFTSGQKVELLQQVGGSNPATARLRFLPVERIASGGSFFQRGDLRKKFYPFLEDDVFSLYTRAVLVAQKKLDPDVARGLVGMLHTKGVLSKLSNIIPGKEPLQVDLTLKARHPMPLHEAVNMYFRERDWYFRIALIAIILFGLIGLGIWAFFQKTQRGRLFYFRRRKWLNEQGLVQSLLWFFFLLSLTWFGLSAILYLFESNVFGPHPQYSDYTTTLMTSLKIFSSGLEGSVLPVTTGGWLTSLFMLAMWGVLGVIYSGIIASIFVERRFDLQRRRFEQVDEENHIVIIGWNPKAENMIIQLQKVKVPPSVVVVTKLLTELPASLRSYPVYLLYGDPQSQNHYEKKPLERASLENARSIIVLPSEEDISTYGEKLEHRLEKTEGEEAAYDVKEDVEGELHEVKLFLRTLSVQRYLEQRNAKSVHVVVQCHLTSTIPFLAQLQVDEVIHVPIFARRMLAQAAVTPLVSRAIDELLELDRSADIFRLDIRECKKAHGKSFLELFYWFYTKDIILLGVVRKKQDNSRFAYEKFYRQVSPKETSSLEMMLRATQDEKHYRWGVGDGEYQGEEVALLPLRTKSLSEELPPASLQQELMGYHLQIPGVEGASESVEAKEQGLDVALLVMAREQPSKELLEEL